jgi:argininosuccinate lyase
MKLWGGRFKGKTDPGFAEFNNSFRFDRRLFAVDVVGSIAYCQALEAAGVLAANEARQICKALDVILKQGEDPDTSTTRPRRRALIRRSTLIE